LNFELVFPVNKKAIIDFISEKDKIIFIEDQDGFLEFLVKQEFFNEIKAEVLGNDIFPTFDSLSIDDVKQFIQTEFGISNKEAKPEIPKILERLGTFCEGCPHRSFYHAIFEGLKGLDGIVGGDIGCSSLPPFKADWLLCMNAGIGISQGIAAVNHNQVMISTGGDGSFFHGGMLSLQSAVENNFNLIHFVFDNNSIAMTGHQYSPSSGGKFDISSFLDSIGVTKHYILDYTEIEKTTYLLRHEIKKKGVRVFWLKGQCALMPNPEREQKKKKMFLDLQNELCNGCSICYDDFACPAINKNENNLLNIDSELCVRCGACGIVCPNDAIKIVEYE
jgi:TPP-dependent indolepyruvate ferredoxin oxidoreductase alpha subunit